MWQKFTERARRTILLAQEEAGRRRSPHVDTEHLLLGLARDSGCVAAHVLAQMNVSVGKVRSEIDAHIQNAPRPIVAVPAQQTSFWGRVFGAKSAPVAAPTAPPEPKLTHEAKRVLQLAADEARRLKHDYIGTEHLLLALIRQDTGIAALVLHKLAVELDKTRAQIVEHLASGIPEGDISFDPDDIVDAGAWSRFTERARRAVVLAQDEAQISGAVYVGTEHLLIGLLRENEGIAAQVLIKMGVSLDKVRAQISTEAELTVQTVEPKLTPKAKQLFPLAADEAQSLRHNYISTEHLLLALTRAPDSLAATILRSLAVDSAQLRAEITRQVAPGAPTN